jgi:ureidoglycolate hydrolase
MVAAPPTDPDDRASLPEPDQLRAFYARGSVGLMLWRGTWHR